MIQGLASDFEHVALHRAQGAGRIAVPTNGAVTRLARLYQDGCAKIRLPTAPATAARRHAGRKALSAPMSVVA